ncbi:hypothetical protein Q3C01_09105 [Bradyrhizobium sp. UFLA05-109]
MTDYHNPAWTEESRFHGALDDVFMIPLVFITLAINKILHFFISILMRMLDYAFPLAMQIVWLPLFAAKSLGDVIVTLVSAAVRFLPLSETKRRQWRRSIRRNWSWFRRKIGYRAFGQAVHDAFESGMAWVFRKCRHLTPNTALLVILGANTLAPDLFRSCNGNARGIVCQGHVLATLDATLASAGNRYRQEQAFGTTGVPGSLATREKTSFRSAGIQGL